jgi:hypothetical protein
VIPQTGTQVRLTGLSYAKKMRERIYTPVAWTTHNIYIMYMGEEWILSMFDIHCPELGFVLIDPPNPTDTAR